MSSSNETYHISGRQPELARDSGAWLSQMQARLHQLTVAWAGSRERRREMRELFRFNDRELRDVGLSRADVMAIHKGTYRKD